MGGIANGLTQEAGMVTGARPIFLDLRKIRLPINALVSILHRITGVLLIVSLPIVLWLFALSLADPAGFERATTLVRHPLVLVLLLVWLWFLMHHLVVGVRFLVLELGIGETRESSLKTARIALITGIVSALLIWILLL